MIKNKKLGNSGRSVMLAKHLAKKGSLWDEKINYRALMETSFIKSKLNQTGERMG